MKRLKFGSLFVSLFITILLSLCLINSYAFTQPCLPTPLGSLETSDYARDVYVLGNTAYVASGSNGLQIIDVSNPTTPTWLGSYDTVYASGIYVSGNTAYVAAGESGLLIIDVTNPVSSTLIGSYDTPGDANSIYDYDNYHFYNDYDNHKYNDIHDHYYYNNVNYHYDLCVLVSC